MILIPMNLVNPYSSFLFHCYSRANTLTSTFLSGNLGLKTFLVNNWTRTVSKPGGGAPMNTVGGALTLSVNVYDNSAVATIGSGAKINQNPVYQTP
jgi:hypothetical protein